MARIKPQGVIITTLDQAKAALADLAVTERSLESITTAMNEHIDYEKKRADALAEPLLAHKKELSTALASFAEINRAELFTRKKSLELPHGTIGFRQSTSIVTRAKIRLGQVLERLKDLGWHEAVKISESVNKDAMRAWADGKLEAVGMERKVVDQFFVEIADETLKPE